MSLLDKKDWKLWFKKLKWELISFKFLSFWTLICLLILCWWSLAKLHTNSIEVAKSLKTEGYIEKEAVSALIIHSQTVIYEKALGHVLLFFGTVLVSIIAIKGVSYWTDSNQTAELIKKLDSTSTNEDLKKFLPNKSRE